MKSLFFFLGLLISTLFSFSQNKAVDAITVYEVERIEKRLASDEMQGRRAATAGIDKAAAFIADEFKKAGLQTWTDSAGYFQRFLMLKPKFISAAGNFDGTSLDQSKIIAFTGKPSVKISESSGYEMIEVKATDTFRPLPFVTAKKNLLVIVHSAHQKNLCEPLAIQAGGLSNGENGLFCAGRHKTIDLLPRGNSRIF